MRRKSKIDIFKSMLIVPVSLWMILFVAIPFIYILVISFMTKDTYGGVVFQFTFENYKNILNVTYLKIFLQSILISGATTVICILIAYPFTYFVAQKTEIKKTIFMSLVVAPFLVNSLIRLFSWINFLRKDGILNSFLINLGIISEPLQLVYNKIGVMVGLVYMLLPYMILPLYSSIEKLDKSLIEACYDLGAKPAVTFRKVIFPLTLPGIFAGSILVFIPSLGLFFVSDLLGGSNTQIIGNLIQSQFITARNWPLGAALSIFLILITLILIKLYQRVGGDMEELGGF